MSTARDFRERLQWDEAEGAIRDGDTRYLMIRADSLMGLFINLEPAARATALEAFCASVREHGARSAERYRQMGAAESEALMAVIEHTAPQLGWGRWTLRRETDERLSLEVLASPFAAGYGPSDNAVCAPIVGMLEAVGTLVLGTHTVATETECVAMGAPACRFGVVGSPSRASEKGSPLR